MGQRITEIRGVLFPNPRHLRAFSLTARLKSVKRAAVEMYLSQPAVTQAIANLETEFGRSFFERTPSGMLLTDVGELFLKRVNRALAELSRGCPRRDKAVASSPGATGDNSHFLTAASIRVIIEVADSGNLELAAQTLQTSRASIQRTMRGIEAAFGENLFVRSSTGVRLSDPGAQLARGAKLALRELEHAQEEIEHFDGQKVGRMMIGSLPLSLVEVVPLAMMRLLDQYPDLSVRIVEGSYQHQLSWLLDGDLDMIVGALRSPPSCEGIVQYPLFDDQLHVVVRRGHPLTRLTAPSLSDTIGYAWVLPRPGTPTRALFHRAFRRRALAEPKRLLEVSSHASLRSILSGSDRVALISRRQIRFEEEAGLLTVLPIELDEASRTIGIVTRSDWEPSQTQKLFIRELRKVALEYADDGERDEDQPGLNRIRMGTFLAPG
ncbi:LysR family transcriptional regulator [Tropicimonas marinistellae]|uniref:LysR family transcriptional regulator n=1 Tax=Tropicimonas marinistellae TaxID=1739787 RepID=UPI0008362A3E|nr:LysR family transcriptional regulator [Tropicimonas marinistellae]